MAVEPDVGTVIGCTPWVKLLMSFGGEKFGGVNVDGEDAKAGIEIIIVTPTPKAKRLIFLIFIPHFFNTNMTKIRAAITQGSSFKNNPASRLAAPGF